MTHGIIVLPSCGWFHISQEQYVEYILSQGNATTTTVTTATDLVETTATSTSEATETTPVTDSDLSTVTDTSSSTSSNFPTTVPPRETGGWDDHTHGPHHHHNDHISFQTANECGRIRAPENGYLCQLVNKLCSTDF